MGRFKRLQRWIDRVINLLLGILILVLLYLLSLIFLFAPFKIPSDSMSPTLIKGDYIIVWKPTLGFRLFDIFAAIKGQDVDIYRPIGFRNVERGDVLVFNFPYQEWDKWDEIKMNLSNYNVKRCIAKAGDTLSIRDGIYEINEDILIGNIESQKRIGAFDRKSFSNKDFFTLPYDTIVQWDIKNFGPMYIPQKGDTLPMNRKHYLLYKRIIEWEQKEKLIYQNGKVLINGRDLTHYCFKNNYYFMGGDNALSSTDSRFWGLLPEEYIVGKAPFILISTNQKQKAIRWDRCMKPIH